jgi:Arc/MetJ-type ribon-helix-helix transcriptional regulator
MALWYYGFMAMRKMTFSVPEPLAAQLLQRVASRDRSRFVSEALTARLQERDLALIRACEVANEDLDVTAIEQEFDGIRDAMAEPWR